MFSFHLTDMGKTFADRTDAAQRLADALHEYKGRHPLILAIPRGAIPMGKVIAEQLDGEFDVVLVRKLGAPYNPEYALGAIDETGYVYLNPDAAMSTSKSDALEEEKARQLDVIKQRRAQYTPFRKPINAEGRIAIIVDDGLATGATMIAALHATRAQHPAELICAVPVAPQESLDIVKPLADKVVCLSVPVNFFSVGQFYRDFPQVDDAEVIDILSQSQSKSLGNHA
jgi:predicted phosphoribosyltransferase